MATAFVQFRIDEKAKEDASSICKQLGIDLPTYIRMAIARLIACQGIPFDTRIAPSGDPSQAKQAPKGSTDPDLEKIKADLGLL